MPTDKKMISFTWDEYLAEMSNYVLAVRRATQLGSASVIELPTRPTDPIPDQHREEARRLSDACDQLMVEVAARMKVISARPSSVHESPHQERRLANFLETDI
jgi:hypothetical protein